LGNYLQALDELALAECAEDELVLVQALMSVPAFTALVLEALLLVAFVRFVVCLPFLELAIYGSTPFVTGVYQQS